jgi:glycosyltransferase involved in cell wall biosynthesis
MIIAPIVKYFLNYGDEDYDIVHDTRGDSLFNGVDVSSILDLYVYLHMTTMSEKLVRLPLKIFENYKRTLKLSKKVIVLNEGMKTEIVSYFGQRYGDKIRVIPPSFDVPLIKENREEKYDVIWVGSSAKRKNLPLFLEAVSNLPSKYKVGLRFNYINKYVSDDFKAINDAIVRLKDVGKTVDMLPPSKSWDALENLYRSSKCLVSTSSYEGFHMPVAEAYLRGVNVVLPKNDLYQSIYGEAEGVHYYKDKKDLPTKISEAVQYGRFVHARNVVEYLSHKRVGAQLKEAYEEALKY